MVFQSVLFYLFSAVLLLAALGVVFCRNPVHSIMCLVLTFFQSSVLWMLIEAEFLAIVLVLVYVGAVMVLFLFVVMMLDVNLEIARRGLVRYAPLAAIIAVLMAAQLIQVIWLKGQESGLDGAFTPYPQDYNNTEALGAVLYTEYVYAFEIAAAVLLLAIIAAISLTMRKRPGLKVQNIARQVAVRAKDRIRLVKMDADKRS